MYVPLLDLRPTFKPRLAKTKLSKRKQLSTRAITTSRCFLTSTPKLIRSANTSIQQVKSDIQFFSKSLSRFNVGAAIKSGKKANKMSLSRINLKENRFSDLFWGYRKNCVNFNREIKENLFFKHLKHFSDSQALAVLCSQIQLLLVKSERVRQAVLNALRLDSAKNLQWRVFKTVIRIIDNRTNLFEGVKFLQDFFFAKNQDHLPTEQLIRDFSLLLKKVSQDRLRQKMLLQLRKSFPGQSTTKHQFKEIFYQGMLDYRDLLSLIFDQFQLA